MPILLLGIAIALLFGAFWLVRRNRWPRVQVRVLKTWEEITGRDDGFASGWLHAELEYWHESKQYLVSWRGDLVQHPELPDTVWMVVDPNHPDQAQMPARWEMSAVLILIAAFLGGGTLYGLLK